MTENEEKIPKNQNYFEINIAKVREAIRKYSQGIVPGSTQIPISLIVPQPPPDVPEFIYLPEGYDPVHHQEAVRSLEEALYGKYLFEYDYPRSFNPKLYERPVMEVLPHIEAGYVNPTDPANLIIEIWVQTGYPIRIFSIDERHAHLPVEYQGYRIRELRDKLTTSSNPLV